MATAIPPQPAAGVVLGTLDSAGHDELSVRVGHVQELLTGYQHGCPELAVDGEPRPSYAPAVALMDRYRDRSRPRSRRSASSSWTPALVLAPVWWFDVGR
jgi:hypothetical protein